MTDHLSGSRPVTAPNPADERHVGSITTAADVLRTYLDQHAPDVSRLLLNADVEGMAMALDAAGRLLPPDTDTPAEEIVWAWDCGEKPYPHPHVGPESWVYEIAPLHWPNGRAIRRRVGPWLPVPTTPDPS